MSQKSDIDFSKALSMFLETEEEELKKDDRNIYAILNKITDFQWNYEIQRSWHTNSDSECHAIVLLDIGRKMQGVGSSSANETENLQESAVKNAILNAFEKMVAKDTKTEYKDVSVPMEKETIPILKKPPMEEVKEDVLQAEPPKTATSVFTSRQVQKMLQFKEDFNIKNDEQLLAHLRTWNPSIQSKTQLNSNNIEDFFKYVDDLSLEVF